MLWNASAIKGYAIKASDGCVGTVSDLLFDDARWAVRWLVVDTGKWLSGRKVLLPLSTLGNPEPEQREFMVELTMRQVKDSPDIDTDRPVSRQMGAHVYDYYGWSPYWGMGLYMGGYGYAEGAMLASPYLDSVRREEQIADAPRDDDDPHLRSIEAVTGYHIHASDGEIGHVEDFLLDDGNWSVRFLIVDTTNWWAGTKVLISPQSVREINWSNRLVNLTVDCQKVKDSPAYDASTTVDGAYEKRFHDHYDDIQATGQP
jgi:sporulation protein YlmC with PRC-barrel domain